MEVINNTKYGDMFVNDILEFLDELTIFFKISLNTLVIDKSEESRGEYGNDVIYLYPDKYETKKSLHWILVHEWTHFLYDKNKALKKYMKGLSYDVLNMTEETFATIFATLMVGGCYDVDWYLKRKVKINNRKVTNEIS